MYVTSFCKDDDNLLLSDYSNKGARENKSGLEVLNSDVNEMIQEGAPSSLSASC